MCSLFCGVQAGAHPVPVGPDPIRALAGFERVYLAPGASVVVTFPLDAASLSRVTETGTRESVTGRTRIFTEGAELTLAVV